ncbi:MAG: glycosyltransferase family 2 protein [Thermoplasmata archaeon]
MKLDRIRTLSTIILPREEIAAPETLYYRCKQLDSWQRIKEGGLKYTPNPSRNKGEIEFSTYFNAFSLTTWCSAAGINSIIIKLVIKGNSTIRIWKENSQERRTLIWEQEANSESEETIEIKIQDLENAQGILYPQFLVRDKFFIFKNGFYQTTQKRRIDPRMAIIMPTYKREKYVKRNINLISKDVLDGSSGEIKIFIIDNGKSVNIEESENISIIDNENYGGAGGFARGILAAIYNKNKYTHALFCDDDVLIEPESIKRLFELIGSIGEKQFVPGGMLNAGEKTRLHEIGAIVNGLQFRGLKANINLKEKKEIINYNKTDWATFWGWWFVCYPIEFLNNNFPLPFFVGWDDVEFGKRIQANGYQPVYLNGVSVWHDEFHKKEMNWRWYYHSRNGIIVNFIYSQNKEFIKNFFRETMFALITYRYERASFLIEGAKDALKGKNYLSEIDPAKFHLELSKKQKHGLTKIAYDTIIHEKFNQSNSTGKIKRLIIKLTLNGHILPNLLHLNASNPSMPGYLIEPLHSLRYNAIFRHPIVLYYEPTSNQGILCHINRKKFFMTTAKLFIVTILLLKKRKKLMKEWRESSKYIGNIEYWKKKYDI